MSVSNVHHRLILEDIGIIGSPQKMEEVSKWQHCVLQFHECIGITYWADDDYCFCYMIIYNFTKLKAVNTFLIDDEQKFGCSPELEVVRRNYIKNEASYDESESQSVAKKNSEEASYDEIESHLATEKNSEEVPYAENEFQIEES